MSLSREGGGKKLGYDGFFFQLGFSFTFLVFSYDELVDLSLRQFYFPFCYKICRICRPPGHRLRAASMLLVVPPRFSPFLPFGRKGEAIKAQWSRAAFVDSYDL